MWNEYLHLSNCSFEKESMRSIEEANKKIQNLAQELSQQGDARVKSQTMQLGSKSFPTIFA